MSLQSFIRLLIPRDDKFFNLLEQQATVVAEATALMLKLPVRNGTALAALEEVHKLEHRGDELVQSINLALDETFVTPIDREDIHTLSSRLDDVLDHAYEAGQAFVTYEIRERTPAMQEMLQALAEAAIILRDTLPQLRQHRLDKINSARQSIIALEKRSDEIYRAAMAALYKDPGVDAKELLRQQTVLNALEEAMDFCMDAMDVLENIAVKHA